jgi:hypothetical protein
MRVPVSPRLRSRLSYRFGPGIFLVLSLILASTVVGWSLGAPATVGPGTTEQGQGADVGEQTPAYWEWEAAQIWSMPTPVPGLVSTSSPAPTVLAATSSSYRINSATAGNTSVRWEFLEKTTAPSSTELELRFTDGLTRSATSTTVYLETGPGTLGAQLTFFLYWDAGSFGPSGVTIQTMHVDVLVCTGIGHCP